MHDSIPNEDSFFSWSLATFIYKIFLTFLLLRHYWYVVWLFKWETPCRDTTRNSSGRQRIDSVLHGWVEDSGSTELLLRLKYLKAMYLSTFFIPPPLRPFVLVSSYRNILPVSSSTFSLFHHLTNVHLLLFPSSVFSPTFFLHFPRRQLKARAATSNVLKTPRLARIQHVQGIEEIDLQAWGPFRFCRIEICLAEVCSSIKG